LILWLFLGRWYDGAITGIGWSTEQFCMPETRMLPGVGEFVVQGITVDGELFQQQGWAGRLCNLPESAGSDGRPRHSSYVRPVVINGVISVVVRESLGTVDPEAFAAIKKFVAEHKLQVRAGRGSRDAEVTGAYPVFDPERRSPGNNKW
jgi:hypothetical protein